MNKTIIEHIVFNVELFISFYSSIYKSHFTFGGDFQETYFDSVNSRKSENPC